MNKLLGKTAVLAAISAAAMGLTSSMAMADGFQPYVSVFAGGSLLNNMHGGYSYSPGYYYSLGFVPVKNAKVLGAPPIALATPGTFTNKFGYSFGLAMGGHISDQIRVEAELSHSHNDLNQFIADTGAVTNLTGGLMPPI